MLQFVFITYRMQRCAQYTHTHTYVHTNTHTYIHTYTHTYTHTCAHTHIHTQASTNMHSKQALSPIHEICRFLWIRKAENLFERERSSELWARHLCRRFQSEIVRAKALARYRHLPNLSVCDSRRSPTSASLLALFRGNAVKAFTTAAIEDDAGTKTASDGALSDRILRKWLARRWTAHLCRV